MIPYSQGLILDNTNNYSIVKTETLFGFGPPSYDNFRSNTSKALEWIITQNNLASRSLQADPKHREFEVQVTTPKPKKSKLQKGKKRSKTKAKRKGKVKKCIVKFLDKEENKKNKRRRGNQYYNKLQKRYLLPLILGLLAAKSLLIPVALKALAFLSVKGLMMGFFSTVMASVLSLKGLLDHSHGYQNRKEDTKTQVEIIQVPSKTEEHYYDDHHYKRGDYVPVIVNE